MQHVDIYTDGAARGNPEGPGGYGTILHYIDSKGRLFEREFSCGYVKTTNNRMELRAVIAGLLALKHPCNVTVYSDSQYVVKAITEGWLENWKKKGWKRQGGELLNVDLWKKLDKLASGHELSFEWVKGHAGHPLNERCDKLATTAADGEDLKEDEPEE